MAPLAPHLKRRPLHRPQGSPAHTEIDPHDPIGPLTGYFSTGREDLYIDTYFGREYPGPGWPEGPLEIMTRTYETVFTRRFGGGA